MQHASAIWYSPTRCSQVHLQAQRVDQGRDPACVNPRSSRFLHRFLRALLPRRPAQPVPPQVAGARGGAVHLRRPGGARSYAALRHPPSQARAPFNATHTKSILKGGMLTVPVVA